MPTTLNEYHAYAIVQRCKKKVPPEIKQLCHDTVQPEIDFTNITNKQLIDINDKYENELDILPSKPKNSIPNPPFLIIPVAPIHIDCIDPQYSTDWQMIEIPTIIANNNPNIISHDIDGDTTISSNDWLLSEWNGVPLQYENMTNQEIYNWLKPTPKTFRGLREEYYWDEIFINDKINPAPGSVDNWNKTVINHFRRLLGFTPNLSNDARLYIEARYADERRYTNKWTDYPGTIGDDAGPCNINDNSMSNSNCGSTFYPSNTDVAVTINNEPYTAIHYGGTANVFPELINYTEQTNSFEYKAQINCSVSWSFKLAHILAEYILIHGVTGPLFNPLYMPSKFGCSWWLQPNYTATEGTLTFRGKFI